MEIIILCFLATIILLLIFVRSKQIKQGRPKTLHKEVVFLPSFTIFIYPKAYIAFKELCKSCDMSVILNEDANASLKIGTDKFGDKVVLTSDNKIYDDRGELYEALNRVACELFPNILGRERWENNAKES